MKVNVLEQGIVEFILADPIPAPGLRPDPVQLAVVMLKVQDTLRELDVNSYAAPAYSYRPVGDSFELYRITSAIPGTMDLRQNKGTAWSPRRKKK